MRPFSGTLPAAGPPRLRARLDSTPDGPLTVLHTGPRAAYFAVHRDGARAWCLGVVCSRAAAVPNALRVALPDLRSLDLAAATIEGGAVQLGSIAIRFARLVDARVPPLRRIRPVPVSGETDRLTAMIGLGGGLTPYGDDVVCGWLAIQRAAGHRTPEVDAAVRDSWSRTTLLSATLLDCAAHGEVLPEFAAYVAALGTADQTRREAALEAIGESSGRGLLEGARLALTGTAQRAA